MPLQRDSVVFPIAVAVSPGRIVQSAPWRLLKYADEGPLTIDQVVDLGERFDLDPGLILVLSSELNSALDPDASFDAVWISRSEAAMTGQKLLWTLLRDLSIAQERLSAGSEKLSNLYTDPNGAPLLKSAKLSLNTCAEALKDALSELQELSQSLEGTFAIASPDKRKISDRRREQILTSIFLTWEDAGRPLTCSTDPLTSERRGPLINFANAVVACVTDPPSVLSGETIFKDLLAHRQRKS